MILATILKAPLISPCDMHLALIWDALVDLQQLRGLAKLLESAVCVPIHGDPLMLSDLAANFSLAYLA